MTYLPGYPCECCGRQSRGITISLPGKPSAAMFCSTQCARIFMDADGELTRDEKAAVIVGGEHGGEYLESIGKTDLSKMSLVEWTTFCGIIYNATCEALRVQADDEIPF